MLTVLENICLYNLIYSCNIRNALEIYDALNCKARRLRKYNDTPFFLREGLRHVSMPCHYKVRYAAKVSLQAFTIKRNSNDCSVFYILLIFKYCITTEGCI
jgi:hypothetical protein